MRWWCKRQITFAPRQKDRMMKPRMRQTDDECIFCLLLLLLTSQADSFFQDQIQDWMCLLSFFVLLLCLTGKTGQRSSTVSLSWQRRSQCKLSDRSQQEQMVVVVHHIACSHHKIPVLICPLFFKRKRLSLLCLHLLVRFRDWKKR